ncbi:MAG: Bug family tripartite tricarboxylate transporter substrate binding protein [Burkholderiales bacterium]
MRRLAYQTVVALVAAAPLISAAQSAYPSRQIRYIVPQAAGGSSDTLSRALAPRLADALGQQVVVDNRPGATGNIGTELVVRAAPDGYTLLQAATSLATNVAMQPSAKIDPLRDLAPVILLSQQPNLWAVHPSLPVKSMRELIAFAKARPGQVDYATSGTGGSQHLSGELLKVMTGADIVHIPYKGSPPALIDVLGGRVAVTVSTLAPAMPHVRDGRLRALAVTGEQRSVAAPTVPTVAESGVPGYAATAWQGVLAPAGTPREVIARVNAEINKALRLPEVQKFLVDEGYVIEGGTSERYTAFIKSEIAKWSKVTKAAGLNKP